MTKVIVTGILACILTGGIGYLLLPILRTLKAGQSIREVGPTWHNNKAGTPMMGGIMFILATVLCLLFNIGVMTDRTVFYTLILGLCYGLVGFLDDLCKLTHKRNLGLTAIQKALLQAAVSAVYLYLLYRQASLTGVYIPFVGKTVPVNLYVLIGCSMFVMVGCVNAVNLTDGVDGLCASVTIPVMVFFTAVAVSRQMYDLALLPACLVGGLIAYLFYNWHPAKVFMGDTGSLFFGALVIGSAFMMEEPIVGLIIAAVFILEMLSSLLQVVYFRLTHGKRLFKMAPVHHHFEQCGWSENRIVFTFSITEAVFCLLAWFALL